MICNFCGNKIDDASEFCMICGQKSADTKASDADSSESVFSQMQQDVPVEAPVAPTETPAEPVAEEAVVVEEAPVVEAPAEVTSELKETLENEKGKKKKAKKPVGFFMRILCFISTIIAFFTYRKALKKGTPERQEAVVNLLGLSICWKLAVVVVYLAVTYLI